VDSPLYIRSVSPNRRQTETGIKLVSIVLKRFSDSYLWIRAVRSQWVSIIQTTAN